ncbi:molybdopterin molybdotransferase MoeA [Arthrobacter sp. AL08]|uniref:molybdopterin molybdotransferase MoeA n=1 Tax=unclassified Arthrobacter TaxID=235627 RepID=UPI00249AA25E|nr:MULTISPECIES: gephyrin-like molybdotransferase Glp [unclassified Arthrobacter]MDI3240749.1 molybdopterin molybdotransferase MoeA [Arthrobacter sp. AL05]MDI3276759.1 molybdopterin molybdotransferase MoeA [Arthrobacter sp. AL08]
MHSTQARHVTVAAHRESVRRLLAPLRTPDRIEMLPLLAALGRGLAADVVAPLDLPPFANSQMDGFAIRSADVPDGGTELTVVAPVAAGAAPPELAAGTAAPIMTGAMLPAGADAVVPIEQADPAAFPFPGEPATVRLPAAPARNFVRDAGSDIRTGELALTAGTCLGPGQLGLLAALGYTEVAVYQALRVLLVTTGDEVVEPGRPLGAGKIYDSNATLLEASMRQAGLDVTRTGVSTDRPEELAALLGLHLADIDLIVTTGGVSKGAYEVVRQAMEGHRVDFFGVAMQPGGPQGIGTFEGVPVLGFPGNPVSCLVSFEMFLRPALGDLFGSPAPRPAVKARLAGALTSPAGKHQVRRGTVLPDGTVRLEGGSGSHLVSALAHSNALIQVPEGTGALAEGAEVEVWML